MKNISFGELNSRMVGVKSVVKAFCHGVLKDRIKRSLEVRFDNAAFTDKTVVHLPKSLLIGETWDRGLVLGLMTHELGHCAFTLDDLDQMVLNEIKGILKNKGLSFNLDECGGISHEFLNFWEDVRIDSLAGISFPAGLVVTKYANETIIASHLKKMGETDEEIVAFINANMPLARQIGLLCETQGHLAMFGQIGMEAELRYTNLLEQALATKMTNTAILEIKEMANELKHCADSLGPALADHDIVVRLAAKTMVIYLETLCNSQKNSEESASADRPEDSAKQSNQAEQSAEQEQTGQSFDAPQSASSAPSANDNLNEASADGGYSLEDKAVNAAKKEAETVANLPDARKEFLLEEQNESYANFDSTARFVIKDDEVDSERVIGGVRVLKKKSKAKKEQLLRDDLRDCDLMYQSCNQNRSFYPSRTLHDADSWQKLIQSQQGSILRQDLLSAMKAQTLKHFHVRGKRGFKLARSSLSRVAQGMPVAKPFAKKDISESLSTKIVLLVDTSGSMSDPVSTCGIETTLAILANCFSRIKKGDKLKLAIYGFADFVYCIKGVNDHFDARTLCKVPQMEGGTNGQDAFSVAIGDLLHDSTVDRKIIVCCTDGCFDEKKSLNSLTKLGIETYGIAYGTSEEILQRQIAYHWLPELDYWLPVENLLELPKVLSHLFTKIVKDSTR